MTTAGSNQSLPPKRWQGRVIDARLQLMDHQILDSEGEAVGVVDDIELDGVRRNVDIARGSEPPTVTSLVGGRVLATRIFGGRLPKSQMHYTPLNLVRHIGTAVELWPTEQEFKSLWAERWLSRHIIGRIPGGEHRAGK